MAATSTPQPLFKNLSRAAPGLNPVALQNALAAMQCALNSGAEQAERLAPQVIVLDYRLPDMEGFQVLEAVRKNRQCHFVLITAHPTVEVRERAAELGVSHVLFKPFPLMELARANHDDRIGARGRHSTGRGEQVGQAGVRGAGGENRAPA